MLSLPPALAGLGQYRQFIICQFVPSKTRPGKTDKYPLDWRTLLIANAHDPAIWLDAETACRTASTLGAGFGVGFVFTPECGYWFLDIDGCALPDRSGWNPLALEVLALLPGAAAEVSHSGEGLHGFGRGTVPPHACKNIPLGLEFYHEGRFVALTGIGAVGDCQTDCSAGVAALVARYFPPGAGHASERGDWTDEPCDGWRGPTDDADLVRRAMRSGGAAAAFGGRACFADLWEANVDVLARAYPDPMRSYDCSSADAALAQHLAFWTGKNCGRILDLMRQSALKREKWADREEYLEATILKACAMQVDVLQDKAPEPPPGAPGPSTAAAGGGSGSGELPRGRPVEGVTYLNGEAMEEVFKGCVYVRSLHRIMIPGGDMLRPDQFKAQYGGYTFCMDKENSRTSKDAWEAFTQNQLMRFPQVEAPAFLPREAPGTILERGGRRVVNTFHPTHTARKQGDPARFLRHVAKILPEPRDQAIILAYMAACVQYQGVKFQWAPFLQGMEGNGKTLLSRCVAEAVGAKHTHWPKASKLAAQFNAWMVGKTVYAVEEIYVPGSKAQVMEDLKVMITGGDGLEIEGKGVDQFSGEICGNFIFTSNHEDGIRKTERDRRTCPLFSAQQNPGDLERDGMSGRYFPELYDWLREEGYAIVHDYLATYPIPDDLNPATHCQRAPRTSSTERAVAVGAGHIEQEILEKVGQGAPGFAAGWLSTMALERLLDDLRAKRMSHIHRREMLVGLGYRPHPGLTDGRVNNTVMPDLGKPRLYVVKGHPSETLRGADVEKAYTAAQTAPVA